MINKVLEYQKLDTDIFKIEKEVNYCESKKTANNLRAYVKDAQTKIISLDHECETTLAEYNDILSNFEKANKQVEMLEKNNKKLTDEERAKYFTQLEDISKVLEGYERKLHSYSEKINNVLRDFEDTKKKVVVAKTKYKEAMDSFEKLSGEKQPEIAKLKAKLVELEKEVPEKMLAKYKSLKQDKIFPPFVPLVENRCGGCRMEISANALNNLKANQILECEHCRRVIYLKK